MNDMTWLSRTAKACKTVADQIERERLERTIAQVRHTVDWHKERERYVKEARKGDRDFALSDVEATADACVEIVQALDLDPEDFKLRVEMILSGLIVKAANGHASQCEANGTL